MDRRKETLLVLFATVGFGVIGFLDDYIKIVMKRLFPAVHKKECCYNYRQQNHHPAHRRRASLLLVAFWPIFPDILPKFQQPQ